MKKVLKKILSTVDVFAFKVNAIKKTPLFAHANDQELSNIYILTE
jgi:hypothetical protein